MTPEELQQCNEQQVRTIRAQWFRISRLEARVEKQQGVIDWLQKNKAALEAQLTDEALAERFFKHGEQA